MTIVMTWCFLFEFTVIDHENVKMQNKGEAKECRLFATATKIGSARDLAHEACWEAVAHTSYQRKGYIQL